MTPIQRRTLALPLVAALTLTGSMAMAGSLALTSSLVSSAPRATASWPQKPAEEIKYAEAWPTVDKRKVKVEVERLRKARVPEMGDQAHLALVAFGPGAAPLLLEKLGKEKGEEALERIEAVLLKLTDATHTRLLSLYFSNKDAHTRIWAMTRVAGFPDAGVRAAAEKAFKAADKRKRDRDPKEVYAAALCCASSGSFSGFEIICVDAESKWKQHGRLAHVALTALRGAEATAKVKSLLEDSERKRKVAGLRLLGAVGDKETATGLVRPMLDSTDNSLRVAAINALRGIVDGDPPLEKLPVFEAIERANKWKSRI
jgi:hypothetical protein